MAWNQISDADVLNEFTPIEKATLQNIQGDCKKAVAAILLKVVKKVRGQIKAGGNQVDQANQTSVPDQLAEEVIAIARWKWLSSFPTLKNMQTDGRRDAAKDAEALLKEIASNAPDRPRVELPAMVDPTPSPVSGVQFKTGRRQASARKMSGLL